MTSIVRLLAASAGLAAIAATAGRAAAMPPFAQAYGVKCSVCHTQVPALNAYGRYVQRSGYSSLDPHVLHRAFPFWVGESANYDSQSGPPPKIQFGNLAIHAVGYLGDDVTYHFQQWIKANNQAGDLDTFWVTYNNLLHRDGHLFVGLVNSPGPSPYSQWMDLAPFSTPEISVGEHTYELDGNGWGSKFNYIKGSLDLEAAWEYGGSGWSQSSAFINSDKRFMYKAAYANPENPFEAGISGSRGSWPLAEGGFDQYWSVAPYVQRDPNKGVPGILAIYQMALDGNPTATSLSAGSTAATLELYQPVFDKGVLSIRKEWTNDGLGTLNQTGNIDFNYQVARYVHAYVEEYFAQHTTPGFAWMVWWTTPLSKVH
ncbi:MAG: hypothetical protein JO192_13605 [Candidatus Eremiobacteraeota bacterium]|nr:hypothetical protein [Candidatus Eremiobacteraeota bacterium]MBV8722738.1 hypothetical protein [Candidatus Eremiobacteraeota bacterium]